MSCLLDKQKHGLILLMSAIVTIAGLLAVISLSVVLVQVNTPQCHVCDDQVSGAESLISLLQKTVDDLNRTVETLMNQLETVLLEQDSKIDSIRDGLAMNITMLSNTLASRDRTGTAVLSGINFFESCTTLIESNCTIQPAVNLAPCQTPEVLLNRSGKFTLDMRCTRAGETLDVDNPLVAILNFAQNFFGESIAECHCYVIQESVNPLTHNVTCGIQVTRCTVPQTITAQFTIP